MDEKLKKFADKTFGLEDNEGEDKVITLQQAIKKNVKPGMVLYFSDFSAAAMRETLRQFWGTKPEFTMIAPARMETDLVPAGLVKRIIGGTREAGDLPFEIWSLAGLNQRLMAGAMGTGFVPTRSMIGTSVAEDNKDSFKVIDDPFGSGKKIGLIKALNPDIAIVHGWAADRYGNTILPPTDPQLDELAALASKNGVVVTVEKLVSTAFIRQHSPLLVKIPGYCVKSVSVVPFGAHPFYMPGWRDLKEFETYAWDQELLTAHEEAVKKPDTIKAWIKDWVLDCPTHEEYLRKLGFDRIQTLKMKGRGDLWEQRLPFILEKIDSSTEYNDREIMIVAAARKIKQTILDRGYKVVLTGAGTGALAPFIAYYQLKKEGNLISLVIGNGVFDYAPRPGEPSTVAYGSWDTCKIRANVLWAYPIVVNGENQRSMSILGAAEIDKFGNINTGVFGGKIVVSPPSGAADAYQACEVVALATQSKKRFVEKVAYITSVGTNVKTLVSTLGVFEKLGDDKEFSLTACLPDPKFPALEDRIKNIIENCGWDLKVAAKVEEISAPTFEELMTLRIIDPDGVYSGSTRTSGHFRFR